MDDHGGPGRFWGYRSLRAVLAVRQVSPATGIAAGRVLRRWYGAKGLTRRISVPPVKKATGLVYYRCSHKRKRLLAHNRGFVTVNDGPAFASQLVRHLTGTPPDRQRRHAGFAAVAPPLPTAETSLVGS